MDIIIGLKDFGENSEEKWEEAIDFTKIEKGGVDIKEVLLRLDFLS